MCIPAWLLRVFIGEDGKANFPRARPCISLVAESDPLSPGIDHLLVRDPKLSFKKIDGLCGVSS